MFCSNHSPQKYVICSVCRRKEGKFRVSQSLWSHDIAQGVAARLLNGQALGAKVHLPDSEMVTNA